MIDYFKIYTPTYGTTDIEVDGFIEELKNRLRQAKLDNKHFDHKCVKFVITKDHEGELWLSGYAKKDLKES